MRDLTRFPITTEECCYWLEVVNPFLDDIGVGNTGPMAMRMVKEFIWSKQAEFEAFSRDWKASDGWR